MGHECKPREPNVTGGRKGYPDQSGESIAADRAAYLKSGLVNHTIPASNTLLAEPERREKQEATAGRGWGRGRAHARGE